MGRWGNHTSAMILDQDKITRIKRLLKSRPKGLTISDVSQNLKINRNSVAKYLEILLITGQVEMRLYGNAKVYYLSQRVPISDMLKFATELILILDTDLKIADVNENFLRFFSLSRENVLGCEVKQLNVPALSSLNLAPLSGEKRPLSLIGRVILSGLSNHSATCPNGRGQRSLSGMPGRRKRRGLERGKALPGTGGVQGWIPWKYNAWNVSSISSAKG